MPSSQLPGFTNLVDLSIIIPTWRASQSISGLFDDLKRECNGAEIIISNAGYDDYIKPVSVQYGARLISGPKGRGQQLHTGTLAAHGAWLLILHGDSRLPRGFGAAIRGHRQNFPDSAGYASLRFNSNDWRARLVACGANLRSRIFALPYGDQGLLIPRWLYDDVGGYPIWPLMEDVELVRKLVKSHGRGSLRPLKTSIITSPERYQRDGYLKRVMRNLDCLRDFLNGVPIEDITRRYYDVAE